MAVGTSSTEYMAVGRRYVALMKGTRPFEKKY